MVTAVSKPSFADAELGEDVGEDVVGGDLAGDGAQVVEDLAELFAEQVGGETCVEGLQGAPKGVAAQAERFSVAAVRDDGVAGVETGRVDRPAEPTEQFVDAGAVFRRDADGVLRNPESGCCAVGFVHDREAVLSGRRGGGQEVRSRFGIIRRGGVQEVQQDAGAADGLLGAFDAHLLEPVLGLVQTRRIDEAEEHAVDVDALLYRVAGRAGDFGDHGTLVADQSVHEGAFPDVGPADDDYRDPLFEGVSEGEAFVQPGDFLFDPLHLTPQGRTVGELDILFREVELQLEQGDQPQQPFAQGAELFGIGPAHLGRGQGVCGPGFGGNRVGDGFGLREVHASGQKGAGGEFAGSSHARPLPYAEVENPLQDVAGAVAGEFDGVVARVGAGSAEQRGDYVVHRLGAVDDGAVVERVPGCLVQRMPAAENAVAQLDGALPADADNAQGPSGSRGGGDDDIVGVDHRTEAFNGGGRRSSGAVPPGSGGRS